MRSSTGIAVVLAAAASFALPSLAHAQSPAQPSVYRVWLNDTRKAHIQIGPCTDAARGPVCGRIVHLLEPKKADGSPATTAEAVNPCDVKAGKSPGKLLDMIVLSQFRRGPTDATVTGGKAYNIEECDTYSIDITALDGGKSLELRHWTGMKRIWTLVR